MFGQDFRTNTSATCRILSLLCVNYHPWRFVEGVKSYVGVVSGMQFFLWGGGWGGWRKKMRGPLTVCLEVLQEKCGCSWRGSGEQGPEIETVEHNFVGRWCPRYRICHISSDILRVQNKEKTLTFNSL